MTDAELSMGAHALLRRLWEGPVCLTDVRDIARNEGELAALAGELKGAGLPVVRVILATEPTYYVPRRKLNPWDE